MKITIILHSFLREKLPPGMRGQATIEFPLGTRVEDVMDHFDLPTQTR
jgi:hypothetical protein